ncbi:MAG: SlyX family protein [Bdellovibrionota bacterium]
MIDLLPHSCFISGMELEQRLVDLETKIAYQDHVIEDLNAVVISQQKQIDQLEINFALFKAQAHAVQSGDNEIRAHEKPPHY